MYFLKCHPVLYYSMFSAALVLHFPVLLSLFVTVFVTAFLPLFHSELQSTLAFIVVVKFIILVFFFPLSHTS